MFLHADNIDADPRLRWMHRSFCLFCHAWAHMRFIMIYEYLCVTQTEIENCMYLMRESIYARPSIAVGSGANF